MRVSKKWLSQRLTLNYFFFSIALIFGFAIARFFFNCWNGTFGVTCCRGHKQKVLALRFSVAMPKDG
jgi:hypothetical protein